MVKKVLGSKIVASFSIGLFVFGVTKQSGAYEINEKLSIEANLTGVYQWLDQRKGNFKDEDRGSEVVDGKIIFKPTAKDEFSLRASFAKGNGLKKLSPFKLSPNADDLRDDLHDINNRARDHLQELWYAHTFNLPANSTLKTTLGIIDSTAYVDQNRFANDEITQFMNEALVNNPLANLISYDYGIAVEWSKGSLGLTFVGMQSKMEEHEDPRFSKKLYNYYTAQISYHLETPLGEGNYRIFTFTTNKRFPDWENEKKKTLRGCGVSLDQDLIKDKLGLFARVGFQDDDAQIDYKSMYSLGLNYRFFFFGGKKLELGVGYSFLKAPSKNEELKDTRALEAYLSIPLYEKEKLFATHLTFDWQWMKDKLRDEENPENKGHIFGVRLNFGF